jgi:hypothetical protein
MAWKVPPDCLLTKRVIKMLYQLYITKEDNQAGEDQDQLIPQTDGEERTELDITEAGLMKAMKRIDQKNMVGVDGEPEDITKIIAEQRPRQLLNLLNKDNRSDKIQAVWKVARVVLLPKLERDPILSSSYRSISILLATVFAVLRNCDEGWPGQRKDREENEQKRKTEDIELSIW